MSETMSEEPNAWAMGYAAFAGFILIIVGVFQAFAGLVAIIDDEYYIVTQEYILQLDPTQWGWIHLIWGIVVMLAGFGIFSGNILARTVGVAAAGISALTAFAWLPAQPVWGILIIALDIAIIWALTVHGRDLSKV
jgi:hypothetical protein